MSKITGDQVSPHTERRRKAIACSAMALLAMALLGAGCGSSTYVLKLRPLPSSAHVYVNGEYQGAGPQNIPLSFTSYERAYVQVVAPNHEPTFSMYWEEKPPPEGEVTISLTEIR